MYSYQQLVEQNLPIYVKVQTAADTQISWLQQWALFLLVTISCLSGIVAITGFTHHIGLHQLPPLGIVLQPSLLLFSAVLFLVSFVALILWLKEDKMQLSTAFPEEMDDHLQYILPASQSLHIDEKAYDLNDANSLVIDFPHRVLVYYKNPDQVLILTDDQTGYNKENTLEIPNHRKPLNAALFTYLSGSNINNRYLFTQNWWWNVLGIFLFIGSTMLPFLFQALGFKLYWMSFLAIPISYLAFRVGQKEFQRHEVFEYKKFLARNHNKLNTKIYKAPSL